MTAFEEREAVVKYWPEGTNGIKASRNFQEAAGWNLAGQTACLYCIPKYPDSYLAVDGERKVKSERRVTHSEVDATAYERSGGEGDS
ncbi:hypothetical protein MRX96_001876 [Rhipicephalus microplus]